MYDELIRERKKQSIAAASRDAGLSGAATGGILGAASSLLGGARKKADLIRSALIGAGLGGGVAGGSTAIGSGLLGAPDEGDAGAFTRRGALGGAVGGGALGAGLGALIQGGRVKEASLGLKPNIAFDFVRSLPRGKAALAGALGLGAIAGYQGADEGMQVDAIGQELDRRRRQQLEELLAGG